MHGASVADSSRTMNTLSNCRRVVLVTLAMLTARSASAESVRAAPTERPAISVQLPKALGGGTELVEFSRPGTPIALHGAGRRVRDKGSDRAGGVTLAPMNTPPATIDLSEWATTAGNQDPYDLCEFWSVGYTSLGWWLNKSGMSGNPMNPMFMYSSLVPSCSGGTSVDIRTPAEFLQSTGNAPASVFPSTACKVPSAAQTAAAAAFEIADYKYLTLITSSATPQQIIETALAAGTPISFSIEAFQELYNVTPTSYLIPPPASGSTYYGSHAITALGYTADGVWFENTWGTDWGKNGWAMLSWDFVNGKTADYGTNVEDAVILEGLVGAPSPDAGVGADAGVVDAASNADASLDSGMVSASDAGARVEDGGKEPADAATDARSSEAGETRQVGVLPASAQGCAVTRVGASSDRASLGLFFAIAAAVERARHRARRSARAVEVRRQRCRDRGVAAR